MPAALLALFAAAYTWEEQGPRLDHRGQLSVYVAPAFEELAITGRGAASAGGVGELYVGIPLNDEGGTLLVGGRAGAGEPLDRDRTRLVAPYVGYRGYAGGDEPWKTFFDVGAMLRVLPAAAVGARLGAGLQLDLGENLGTYLAAGVALAGGDGMHLSGDVALGIQLRFGDAG